jgi:putative flippase GtrA
MDDKKEIRRAQLTELVAKKARFAVGSVFATGINYLIYFPLFEQGVAPAKAEIIAYSSSVIVSFLFQKYFVFEQQGATRTTFMWSMLVSLGGLILSTGIIHVLNWYAFFQEYQLIAKLMTTGLVFFYNFYCKRYVFERRFI